MTAVPVAALLATVLASSQAGVAAGPVSGRRPAPGLRCRAVAAMRSDVNLTSDLAGIAVASPCNAWAVGTNLDKTLIEHWDGRAWKQVRSPNKPRRKGVTSEDSLSGVAASSFGNAWAVGSTNAFSAHAFLFDHTLTEHWNGARWSRVPSPDPGSGQNENVLEAVAATSNGGAWAVGWFTSGNSAGYQTLILRWQRGRWARVPSPTPQGAFNLKLTGVSVISSSDAWAVGYYSLESPGVPFQIRTLTEHWDGQRWTIVPSPDPAGHGLRRFSQLDAVAATASGVWAVGTYARPGAGSRTLTEFWNGSTWARVPSPTPPGRHPAATLSAVTVLPGGHAWAAGGYGATDPVDTGHGGHTLIEYWNGLKWHLVPSPSRPQPFSFSTWTAVAAASPGTVMTAGTWICHGAVEPLAARLAHGRWQFVRTPNVSRSKCPV